MSKFAPSINIAPQPQRPLPKTEIFWGSQDGGCNAFPTGMEALSHRRYSDNPTPLKTFGQAVSNALDRVWIIDEYFLMPEGVKADSRIRIAQILGWLHVDLAASDVRILTKHHEEVNAQALALFQKRAQAINEKAARRPKKCAIEVRTHLTQRFDFIHDRFAIIDDELWHFGGTVGGFLARVSAASRGWRASDHGAPEFFDMAWKAGDKQ